VTAAELFAELDRLIAVAPPADRPAIVVQLAARVAAAGAGLVVPEGANGGGPDEAVDVEEGARRIGMSPRWIYRNAEKLAFVKRQGRRVTCSVAGITAYLQGRRG
jgi:hypothetical protein